MSDNLNYDEETNSILVGNIGGILTGVNFIKHNVKGDLPKDFQCWCGSEKINLDTNESEELVIQDKFCGVSSAMQIKNKVFLGSWADDGILVCNI